MVPRSLSGKKIAVILESKFIPEEIHAYSTGFALLGADVHFMSRIWYGDYKPERVPFFSDVDPLDDPEWSSAQRIYVTQDTSTLRINEYAAVIMSANYTSVRLRYSDLPSDPSNFDARSHVQAAPVARLFAEAMADKRVVKGFLCHGLWILTPFPELLRGRKVICHSVVMADVINCGAEIVLTPDRVVTDDDVVTGFSKHEVVPFIAAISDQITKRSGSARS